jgi:hypothetical protein
MQETAAFQEYFRLMPAECARISQGQDGAGGVPLSGAMNDS